MDLSAFIPVANGENKTVIYLNVLILATTEQAAGFAPVPSATAIKLLWRKCPSPAHNKTLAQRIWPGTEARCRPARKTAGGIPDPRPITDATTTLTASAEALYSNTTGGKSDGENDDSSAIMSKMTSNVNRVMLHEHSGKSRYAPRRLVVH
ncbi:hypothetical protein F5X99DRAFT_406619 [Biscogniauxia marginata]|nr:hypothetical protein F5X99DRAFT_406619 [Biscogniauxia marginata]